MSSAIFELHERYPHEVIGEADHAVVHEEFTSIGMGQTCLINGVSHRLPRGSYFSETTSLEAVRLAWESIQCRLHRTASVFVTTAEGSFGYGLRTVAVQSGPPLRLANFVATLGKPKTALSLLDVFGEKPGVLAPTLSGLLPVRKAR